MNNTDIFRINHLLSLWVLIHVFDYYLQFVKIADVFEENQIFLIVETVLNLGEEEFEAGKGRNSVEFEIFKTLVLQINIEFFEIKI